MKKFPYDKAFAIFWAAGILVLIPLLTLLAAGLAFLWQQDLLLTAAVGWLAVSLVTYAIYRLWPEAKTVERTQDQTKVAAKASDTLHAESEAESRNAEGLLPHTIEEQACWSDAEQALWSIGVQQIDSALENHPDWGSMPALSLQLLSDVAQSYTRINTAEVPSSWQLGMTDLSPDAIDTSRLTSELKFSLPEILLVSSIACDRYRQVVLEYLPFAESITVATAVKLYQQQGALRKSARWINSARRLIRLANPASAVAAELREQFTNRIFTHASVKVQNDLKRLLLQEVLQVSMDLNSGRLKNSEQEISSYRSEAFVNDEKISATPAEPIRIVLLGQMNSGKSSLINALANELRTETDSIPTTASGTVHVLAPDQGSALHIVDTAGLENNNESVEQQCQLAMNADLMVHMVKATQPARAADQLLYESIDRAYENQPLRRRPPTLMILTHIDQLSPKAQWEPPYDLASDSPKAITINKALLSARRQIGLPAQTPAIPVCLSMQRGLYNVDAVMSQFMMLETDARQSQFNRRRSELGGKNTHWSDRWKQFSRLGRVVGKSIVG